MMRSFLVVVVLALGIAGCKKHIDPSKVEKEITRYLSDKRVVGFTVSCPKVAVEENATFQCDIAESDGTRQSYTVTQTSAQGDLSVKFDPVPVDTEIEIIKQVKARIPGAEIKCPRRIMWVRGGESFTCTIAKAKQTKLTVTVDAKGNMTPSWQAQ
ncbi:MAG: DUF4333 domain-containing protein [Deltaproteobacteria bacterium]|nr:DUF4333 domain-containing protein [Deltaproteobacteria bacterium]